MLDFKTILTIVQGASQALPALDALVDQVAATFGEEDQAKLKAAYAEARRNTDAAHNDLQGKLDGASRR